MLKKILNKKEGKCVFIIISFIIGYLLATQNISGIFEGFGRNYEGMLNSLENRRNRIEKTLLYYSNIRDETEDKITRMENYLRGLRGFSRRRVRNRITWMRRRIDNLDKNIEKNIIALNNIEERINDIYNINNSFRNNTFNNNTENNTTFNNNRNNTENNTTFNRNNTENNTTFNRNNTTFNRNNTTRYR